MADEISMEGEGNQPEGTGWAAPDTGQGDAAESEIPVGVDQIEHTAGDDDGDEGGSAAIDLANLDVGDDGEASLDATEADPDAEPGDVETTAEGDADAEAGGDADAEAEGEPAAE